MIRIFRLLCTNDLLIYCTFIPFLLVYTHLVQIFAVVAKQINVEIKILKKLNENYYYYYFVLDWHMCVCMYVCTYVHFYRWFGKYAQEIFSGNVKKVFEYFRRLHRKLRSALWPVWISGICIQKLNFFLISNNHKRSWFDNRFLENKSLN